MKRWLPLVVLAACTSENPDLVIERQPTAIAQASDSAWTRGSVILAGDPGTFTFPQPVSLRISIVDDAAAEMPATLTISQGKVAAYGSGEADVSVAPVCQPTFCTAELDVTAAGTSMFAITADGPQGIERNCFYYAVVDGTTDTDALRADLEVQQRDCRFATK